MLLAGPRAVDRLGQPDQVDKHDRQRRELELDLAPGGALDQQVQDRLGEVAGQRLGHAQRLLDRADQALDAAVEQHRVGRAAAGRGDIVLAQQLGAEVVHHQYVAGLAALAAEAIIYERLRLWRQADAADLSGALGELGALDIRAEQDVLHAARRADIGAQEAPAVNADAHAERERATRRVDRGELRHRALHAQPGADGAGGVAAPPVGREYRQQRVAGEFEQIAARLADDLDHRREVAAEQLEQCGRARAAERHIGLDQWCEAGQVGEHQAALLPGVLHLAGRDRHHRPQPRQIVLQAALERPQMLEHARKGRGRRIDPGGGVEIGGQQPAQARLDCG